MAATAKQSKKIIIEPVTRVEGHGKVSILLDENDQVTQARLHIVEFRGFERFIQGRPYWEAPVLVQRLCGICPVSHHLAAAKAMDRLTHELSIGVKRKGLVVNRAPETLPEPLQMALDEGGLELWATLPEDPLVNEYDAYGRPLATLPTDTPVVRAIEQLADKVLQPQEAV